MSEGAYYLSLSIKESNTLIECFENQSQPETINDYSCENCKKNVQAVKKLAIS